MTFAQWDLLTRLFSETQTYIAHEIENFRPCYASENHSALMCKNCNPTLYKTFIEASQKSETSASGSSESAHTEILGRDQIPIGALVGSDIPLDKFTIHQLKMLEYFLTEAVSLDTTELDASQIRAKLSKVQAEIAKKGAQDQNVEIENVD